MKDIYIIGAGGFGREVAWLIERINMLNHTWNIVGFIDDNPEKLGEMCGKYPIIGNTESLKKIKDAYAVCAVGASHVRRRIIEGLSDSDVAFPTLIDPSVIFSDRVTFGEGCIVCAGTILTVDVSIGSHVIINLDCTVGHDAVIKDFVTIYPSANVSGMVNIGEECEIGTGAQIIQGKTICDGAILGAGTVVVKNLLEKGTYIGIPSRINC